MILPTKANFGLVKQFSADFPGSPMTWARSPRHTRWKEKMNSFKVSTEFHIYSLACVPTSTQQIDKCLKLVLHMTYHSKTNYDGWCQLSTWQALESPRISTSGNYLRRGFHVKWIVVIRTTLHVGGTISWLGYYTKNQKWSEVNISLHLSALIDMR